jgi:predicted enzyme related to lactoylglutathione lyase
MLTRDGTPRAGMGQLATAGREPLWLPYVNVEDPQAIATTTLTLGGTVLIAPDSSRRNGTVAVIADPTGGILAVQQWNASQQTEGNRK